MTFPFGSRITSAGMPRTFASCAEDCPYLPHGLSHLELLAQLLVDILERKADVSCSTCASADVCAFWAKSRASQGISAKYSLLHGSARVTDNQRCYRIAERAAEVPSGLTIAFFLGSLWRP